MVHRTDSSGNDTSLGRRCYVWIGNDGDVRRVCGSGRVASWPTLTPHQPPADLGTVPAAHSTRTTRRHADPGHGPCQSDAVNTTAADGSGRPTALISSDSQATATHISPDATAHLNWSFYKSLIKNNYLNIHLKVYLIKKLSYFNKLLPL